MFDEKKIIEKILNGYELNPFSYHGIYHLARVYENGTKLAEMTGADIEVVQLFSLFHDCRRENENYDEWHGKRGAEFAKALRGKLLQIDDQKFCLLYKACALHTKGGIEENITIQVCWDADRLDLGRVGINPDPKRLYTNAARALLSLAHARATQGYKPKEILKRWDIEKFKEARNGRY